MFRIHALGGVSVVALQLVLSAPASVAHAQSGEAVLPPVTVDAPQLQARRAEPRPVRSTAASGRGSRQAAAAPQRQLPVVVIETKGGGANAEPGTPPAVARFQLPQQSFSITDKQINETINLKDPEDAVKYLPSLFVRKRNDGDNQAVLATRSWGLNSSARTLIYYDDLLISALIGNNNSGASPRWNLISPEAIARVDFLNGPFSAAYPGNSIGGVLLITSKRPDKPFAVAKETVSIMPWNSVRHQRHLCDQPDQRRRRATATARCPGWSVANYLDSYQQPLSYVTNGATGANPSGIPPGTRGTFPATEQAGASSPTWSVPVRSRTRNRPAGNFRLAYDVTSLVQATYSFGVWNNRQVSNRRPI